MCVFEFLPWEGEKGPRVPSLTENNEHICFAILQAHPARGPERHIGYRLVAQLVSEPINQSTNDTTMDALLFLLDNSKEDNKDGKTEWPEFPGEKPTKGQLIKWLETWTDLLGQAGYASIVRGELPPDLAKLAERDLVDVSKMTEAQKAAIAANNGLMLKSSTRTRSTRSSAKVMRPISS